MLPMNPYIAGNPVGRSGAFLGRSDVLETVNRVLRRPNDHGLVLFGQRRIGKTSILQYLSDWLPSRGPFHPVYFDLQDKAASSLDQVINELARAISHALRLPEYDLGPDAAAEFRWSWLPRLLSELPHGERLVLLFDEFDVLADLQADRAAVALFPYLRDLLADVSFQLFFVFVIGRTIEDLSNMAQSLFKTIPACRVSLIPHEDTRSLIRLSEVNGSLFWSDAAVEHVWGLTQGHPYLTQMLCSHVWEQAYDAEPEDPPTVSAADVDVASADALESSRNALEWLWKGLTPSTRVVSSALAEAGSASIGPAELEQRLYDSGVKVILRDLRHAPDLLSDWDIIERSDSGFRFRVEILRRWIVQYKPFRRVQEEMDYIEPAAESLYRAAEPLYRAGKLNEAAASLQQAVRLNENHVRANELLADILVSQRAFEEAQNLLERLYRFQPEAARPRLVQLLLLRAELPNILEDVAIGFYDYALTISPNLKEARERRHQFILRVARNLARFEENWMKAASYLRLAGENQEAERIEQRRHTTLSQQVRVLLADNQYNKAKEPLQILVREFPHEPQWVAMLESVRAKLTVQRDNDIAADKRLAKTFQSISLTGSLVALVPLIPMAGLLFTLSNDLPFTRFMPLHSEGNPLVPEFKTKDESGLPASRTLSTPIAIKIPFSGSPQTLSTPSPAHVEFAPMQKPLTREPVSKASRRPPAQSSDRLLPVGLPQSSASGAPAYFNPVDGLKNECSHGRIDKCVELANRYDTGSGVSKDEKEAIFLYQNACGSGNLTACALLGLKYERGEGVRADMTTAINLHSRACNGGLGSACFNLGWAFERGDRVTRDLSKALMHYQDACRNGNSLGCEKAQVIEATIAAD